MNTINKLRPDTAPGPDKIYARTLKELKTQVSQPLLL